MLRDWTDWAPPGAAPSPGCTSRCSSTRLTWFSLAELVAWLKFAATKGLTDDSTSDSHRTASSKQSDESQESFPPRPCANVDANWCRTCRSIEQVMRGTLSQAYKRCGRPNCHCVDGPGHGPKHYLSVSQPSRRPRRDYVRNADVGPCHSVHPATCTRYAMRSTKSARSTPSFCDATRILDRSRWISRPSSST